MANVWAQLPHPVDLFYHIFLGACAIVTLISILKKPELGSYALGTFIIVNAIVEWILFVLNLKPESESLLYNILVIFDCLFFIFYYFHFLKNKKYKRGYLNVGIVIHLFCFYQLWTSGIVNISIYNLFALSILGIIGALLYMLELIENPNSNQLASDTNIWVSFGVILSSSFLILRVGAMFYLKEHAPAYLEDLDRLHAIINIITYSLYLRGILCLIAQKKFSLRTA